MAPWQDPLGEAPVVMLRAMKPRIFSGFSEGRETIHRLADAKHQPQFRLSKACEFLVTRTGFAVGVSDQIRNTRLLFTGGVQSCPPIPGWDQKLQNAVIVRCKCRSKKKWAGERQNCPSIVRQKKCATRSFKTGGRQFDEIARV